MLPLKEKWPPAKELFVRKEGFTLLLLILSRANSSTFSEFDGRIARYRNLA